MPAAQLARILGIREVRHQTGAPNLQIKNGLLS